MKSHFQDPSLSHLVLCIYFSSFVILNLDMALVVHYQMASELHGMLAGNVSMVTGDNMKPDYGGEDESFLSLVVTPIYEVIAKVSPLILIKAMKLILN